MKNISIVKLSFLIALIYVALGTIYSYTYWTYSNPMRLNETLGHILFYFFLPTSFIAIMILFSERDPNFLIFISQTITLLIVWGFTYGITSMFRSKKRFINHTNTDDYRKMA